MLAIAVGVFAANTLKEDFNSLTSGSWNTATKVTLPSGEWTFGGGSQYNKSSNVISIKFNNNGAYAITPKLDKVAKIGFTYRSGGSNKKIVVSYSTDGSTWTELSNFTIASSSSAFSAWSKKTGLDDVEGVQFRILAEQSNCYMDDFVATYAEEGSGGDTPVTDPDDPTYITTGTWIPVKAIPAAKNTYYISPNGDDANGDGSLEKPWFNLAKAYDNAQPGDHIVCRGGTYKITDKRSDGKYTIRMNKVGTESAPIVIRCYDGERPVIDFENQLLACNRDKSKVGNRGIELKGNYHIIYGIHFMHAADNAIKLEGNYNRIERCEFSYNLDSGIQMGFGHDFSQSGFGSKNDGSHCAYNDIIDCDSHHNCDFDMNYGSDADGFACKMHNGKGNRFIRCRSWRNSDDAWDLYETDYSVVIAECWAWESGKAEDHTWVKEYFDGSASFSGNGNGIKLGGNGTGGSSAGIHYAYNCIAFGCDKSGSVKGFDCNSHKGGHVLIGCLGFNNGYDFMFESGGSAADTYFYNNVCLGRQEICVGTDNYNAVNTKPTKNAWSNHLLVGVTPDDYISLDEDEALKPRSVDGSFPRKFGRLAADSKMVDAGSADYDLPVGTTFDPLRQLIADYPFLKHEVTGASRDLGPYERPASSTGITLVNNAKTNAGKLYNISGQRVGENYRGVVIKNNKKYIVR